jgi:hypothetical protein
MTLVVRKDWARPTHRGELLKESDAPNNIRAKILANRERRLRVAAAMKIEAGVAEHIPNARHDDLSGLAWTGTGKIRSPIGRNLNQLYTLAHECGHIFLHDREPGCSLPSHVKEMEAESYAHQCFAAHGLKVPRWASAHGRHYVGSWVARDREAGIRIDVRAVSYAAGTRCAHEPLRLSPPNWNHEVAPSSFDIRHAGPARAPTVGAQWRSAAQTLSAWRYAISRAFAPRGEFKHQPPIWLESVSTSALAAVLLGILCVGSSSSLQNSSPDFDTPDRLYFLLPSLVFLANREARDRFAKHREKRRRNLWATSNAGSLDGYMNTQT